MLIQQNKINRDIRIFIFITLILIVIGLIFIYSASSIFALEKCGSSNYFVKKQFIGVLIGSFIFTLACAIPISFIKRITPLFFIATLALTSLTLYKNISTTVYGSSRWISIGGFSFQPSELLKVSLILYTAWLLVKKEEYLNSFWYGYAPFLILLAISSLLLLAQPDFGSAVTLCITVFTILFIANFHVKHLLFTLSSFIPILVALIYFKPYRWKRILTFLNPWADPRGAGFQIIQSLIAIGSGNIWGIGIAQSKQKFFYLPMQHTDFIFSIIAEETGFLGTLTIILLFIFFLYFGMRIAWQVKDQFAIYTILGFVIMISLQAVINIFVVTGLMPTKGLGLPFISYGLSALISNMAMIGIIVNCAKNQK